MDIPPQILRIPRFCLRTKELVQFLHRLPHAPILQTYRYCLHDVLLMFCPLEQVSHLGLCKPHCFILHTDINLGLSVGSLIYQTVELYSIALLSQGTVPYLQSNINIFPLAFYIFGIEHFCILPFQDATFAA